MPEPAAEVHIDEVLVANLLREQHPDLAGLPIQPVGSGWDNAIFRLGPDLSVRLPRRALSVPLVLHEQRWLPVLAPGLSLPVPVPIRTGVPGSGYPWPWSVTAWFPGTTAENLAAEDLGTVAGQLGTFVRSLHRPAPVDAPLNPYRGVPLALRDQRTCSGVSALEGSHEALLRAWSDALETPGWDGPPTWLHGDLHPLNLVVNHGRLSAVIDFGDVCAGDPATDLAVGWMLFPRSVRSLFQQAVGVDPDTWRRGRGWAITLGVAWLAGGEGLSMIGRRALSAVLEDG
ncbi:MAG TPA: aminoglycoside phosphotransferase family protein [Acidimicrobiia bacterium]|nr:aminoglycoside phosphotransferase family protein [Acidimicrobiia bacterium]